MAENFGDCWRAVKLHAPGAGVFLCRDWVQTAWKQLCGKRPWSFLRGQLQIQISASRTVTVQVQVGSTTVMSPTGDFLTTDESRQFQTSFYPTYTIAQYVSANQITLDQPYGVPTGTGNILSTVTPFDSTFFDTAFFDTTTKTNNIAGTIFDHYYVAPVDFGNFVLIGDPYYQRRIAFWIDQDQLNILDPTRQASDTGPRLLASLSPSTYAGGILPSTLGQIRYEYWPRPTAARTYPALYQKQPKTMADTDVFSGVLTNRAVELLKLGALAQAARWPGSPDAPNPYYNAWSAKTLREDFELEAQRLGLADDNHYSNDLTHVHWERWPLADLAFNDKSLRATDATIADLY